MKKYDYVYELVTSDRFEFTIQQADSLEEMSKLTGFDINTLKKALIRDSVIAGYYKIYKVDLREPEEQFCDVKKYKKFCVSNNLDENNTESLIAYRKYCFGIR